MNISVSLLSTYAYCERKAFLQQALKLKEPLKPATLFGSIRHEALELGFNHEQQLIQKVTSAQDLTTHYLAHFDTILRQIITKRKHSLHGLSLDPLDAYDNAFPSLSTIASQRSLLVQKTMESTNLQGSDLWNALTPKITSEFKVESNKLRLKGIVDQVHHHQDSIMPVELKTGKAPHEGVWPAHRLQVVAYALLLEEKHNKQITQAQVHYLDSQKIVPISINPFMKLEIKRLVEEVLMLLDNKFLPDFCSNKNKCTSCGLKKRCHDPQTLPLSLLTQQKIPIQE